MNKYRPIYDFSDNSRDIELFCLPPFGRTVGVGSWLPFVYECSKLYMFCFHLLKLRFVSFAFCMPTFFGCLYFLSCITCCFQMSIICLCFLFFKCPTLVLWFNILTFIIHILVCNCNLKLHVKLTDYKCQISYVALVIK